MSKYLITLLEAGKQVAGLSMILEYDDTDNYFLKSWAVNGEWPLDIWRSFWKCPPINQSALLNEEARPAKVRVEVIDADLSFARFWEEYGHKQGNKAKIERQFDELPEADKIKIFKAIPRYHRYLTISGVNQAMASTWLNQERWNNEYTTKPKNKT